MTQTGSWPRMIWRVALCLLLCSAPASAMVGPTRPGTEVTRAVVMITGSRGTFCTGTLIARDLVLTAAHCVQPGADYKLIEFDPQRQPTLRDTARIERHPQFSMQTFLASRATADVALIKLSAPAAGGAIAPLFAGPLKVAPGDRFTVAGYGLAVRGDGRSGGTSRAADLVATGRPGNLQIRLVDPAGNGERPGAGACTGDSGAPAFVSEGGRLAVIGVVSWSTGPNLSDGCGGMTGLTPLSLYRGWIVETARRLGSPVGP